MMRKNKKITIILLALLFVVPMFCIVALAQDLNPIWGRLIYVLTATSLVSILAATLTKRKTLWVLLFVLPFVVLDVIHVLAWHHTPTLMWWDALWQVDTVMLWMYLKQYWWGICIIVALFLAFTASVLASKDEPLVYYPSQRHALLWPSLAWLAIVVAGCTLAHTTSVAQPFLAAESVTPIGDVLQIGRLHSLKKWSLYNQDKVANTELEVHSTAQSDELVILVIGESGRYDNWQLNGYWRETTPRMMKRSERLISFDSCYVSANRTDLSVSMLMTGADPMSPERMCLCPTFPRLYRVAGYTTAWLTNQNMRNSFFMQHVAEACDEHFRQRDILEDSYDRVLLPPLQQSIRKAAGKPQLAVVHTMGSHYSYTDRYPREMARWTPDEISIQLKRLSTGGYPVKELKDVMLNSYDNSIYYTDYILDAIIASAEATGRPAVVVYISDHGESLAEGNEVMFYQGQNSTNPYEYHVPFVVWVSAAYENRYPQRIAALRRNRHAFISSAHLYNTMLTLGGIAPDTEAPVTLAADSISSDSCVYHMDMNLNAKRIDR